MSQIWEHDLQLWDCGRDLIRETQEKGRYMGGVTMLYLYNKCNMNCMKDPSLIEGTLLNEGLRRLPTDPRIIFGLRLFVWNKNHQHGLLGPCISKRVRGKAFQNVGLGFRLLGSMLDI